MAGPVSTTPFGIQDVLVTRAVAVIGPNTRVKGTQGLMGTAVDQLIFGGAYPTTLIGKWLVPNTRVQISGVPTVGVSSVGMGYVLVNGALLPTGPLFVSQPDTKISNT
jgi:hypothetical protein